MTKTQKVENVTRIVEEARRWYTLEEFSNMFLAIWGGMETAKAAAIENTEPVGGSN